MSRKETSRQGFKPRIYRWACVQVHVYGRNARLDRVAVAPGARYSRQRELYQRLCLLRRPTCAPFIFHLCHANISVVLWCSSRIPPTSPALCITSQIAVRGCVSLCARCILWKYSNLKFGWICILHTLKQPIQLISHYPGILRSNNSAQLKKSFY